MEINITAQDGVATVRLNGDVDLYSSPQIRNEFSKLLEGSSPIILLDFSSVEYIDSSGLATLIELLQKLRKCQGSLSLFGLSDTVKSVFALAKLEGFFRIFENEQSALEEASGSKS